MTHGMRRLGVIAAVCAAMAVWAASAQAYVYWTNDGPGNDNDGTTIGRANLDGSGVAHSFLGGAALPAGIAVDAGHIYWANTSTDSIGRANLDGTGVEPNFIAHAADPDLGGGTAPAGVTTDGTYVYWTDGEHYVGRATLSGGSISQHFINMGSTFPIGIAYASGTLYVSTTTADVWQVAANGLSLPTVLVTLQHAMFGARAIAVAAGFVYIDELNGASGNTIGRVGTDGANLNESFIPNLTFPTGVASDGTYVYWVDHNTNSIGRALIGTAGATNVESSFVSEPDGPNFVAVDSAVDPTHTTVSCLPPSVTPGSPTSCAATVSDSASSAPPTGSVVFSGDATTFFSGSSSSCTLAPRTDGTVGCTVGVVPTLAGTAAVHAAYNGDSIHSPSATDVTICAGTATACGHPPPPPPPKKKPNCVVPKLKGRSLSAARTALSRAHCALGRVRRPHARKGHKLRRLVVGSESPKPGRKLANGTKVAVVLVQVPLPRKRH